MPDVNDLVAVPLNVLAARVDDTEEAAPASVAPVNVVKPRRRAPARKPKQAAARKAKPATSKDNAAAVAHLDGLHAQWRSSLSTHRLKVEARFLEVRRALAGKGDSEFRVDSAKDAKKVESAIRRLSIKPKKGRIRDLRRVDHLLTDLLGRVED